jgi:ligand-binding sensor domain-containing protein/signal transduction histidine kinase
MRYLLISIFLLTSIIAVHGQPELPDLDEYSIQVWSSDEGLPSNNLIGLKQSNEGYLWITSYNGLIRFDGNTFDVFNSDGIPELHSNGFSVLSTDSAGIMYFGTLTSGLLQYDGKNFVLDHIENNFSASITTIHVDKANRVWIGVKNRGVYYKDPGTDSYQFFDNDLLKETTVECILQVNDNDLLFSTDNKGIIRFSNGELIKTASKVLDEVSISALLSIDGVQYAGTSNGVYKFDINDWSVIAGTEGYSVNSLKKDEYNNLWVATETGIIRIEKNGDVQYLKEADGLPSRQISGLEFDQEGNIWLTSKRGGLVQLKNSNFINISLEDGLSNQYVNIICQLNDGTFAIGNDNGGIDLLNDNKVLPVALNSDLSSVSIKDIIQDSNGVIWVATYKGLLRLEDGKEQLLTKSDGLLSNNIRSLFEDEAGNLWVGAKDGGILRFNTDGTRSVISTETGLSDNYVFCFEQLPNGNILAGTYHGGVTIIKPDDSIDVINVGSDESSPLIFNIEVIDNESFWMATDVGLYKYQDGTFKYLNKSNGLLVSTIFDVYSDNLGYLWATSNMGIVRLDESQVNEFFNGGQNSITARIYDEKDGMLSGECTGATRVLIAENGEIWVPTSKGISILDPANIRINKLIPPVYIKSVSVDDKEQLTGDGAVVLEPGSQRLRINFTALSYSSPAKIMFKYRLKGYEKNWNNVGNQHQATYMNLPDGNFTFEVTAANNDGYWNENPATFSIVVKPYFYKSRLFFLLLVIFLLVVAFTIYWIRIKVVEDKNRELHKLNSELDSFVYSVSHDLRAPLSSILGLISVSKIDTNRKNLPEYLNKIESSVHKLDAFIKDIISYSRNVRTSVDVEAVNIKSLIEDVFENLAYMNTDNVISISLDISDDLTVRTDRTRLQVILSNVISNGFRYFKPYINDPFINVRANLLTQGIMIQVEDNGVGIKSDQLSKIFDMFYRASENSNGSGLGLYIARESVLKLEGSIKVESEYERGTKFTVVIPNL